MRNQDPLRTWLFHDQFNLGNKITKEWQPYIRESLDQLADLLDNLPDGKKIDYRKANLPIVRAAPVAMSPGDVGRAQTLYHRVYEAGGIGNYDVQATLLYLLALTKDPSSIPFWLGLLDLTKPRDQFAPIRRQMALAALAYLAIQGNEQAAYTALRQAARHAQSQVRAQAIHYLGRAYLEPPRPFAPKSGFSQDEIQWYGSDLLDYGLGLLHLESPRPLPPDVQDEISNIATNDADFEPRFQARAILKAVDLPIPFDNPDGVFAFKITFQQNKRLFYRTIEMLAEHTLDDLHYAIQGAINWDCDHLYSFFMNGQEWDDLYRFSCPYEEERLPHTTEAVLGELGLVEKHTFLYLFDYGDDNLFEVEMVGIHPKNKTAKYPRVTDKKGKSPSQYGW